MSSPPLSAWVNALQSESWVMFCRCLVVLAFAMVYCGFSSFQCVPLYHVGSEAEMRQHPEACAAGFYSCMLARDPLICLTSARSTALLQPSRKPAHTRTPLSVLFYDPRLCMLGTFAMSRKTASADTS